MTAARVRLNCANDSCGGIADIVARVAADAGLPDPVAYRLRLAADELATNIAMHGYHGTGGVLDVESGCDTEWVWLRLEDEAPPFDPSQHCVPPSPDGEPRFGGYGIFLAITGVDKFTYDHVGGRNRCTLSMRRPAGSVATSVEDGGTHGGAYRPGDR